MLKNVSGDVSLRALITGDKERLTLLADNRKIYDHVRDFFPHPYTEKNAEDFIALCLNENPKTTFAIDFRGELTGVIGLVLQSDIYRKSAELGYWLGEPFWNLGIATRSVNLMVDYGFKSLDLIRIYAGVFEHNRTSQRVLEKCGFTLEGIFRKSVIKNGQICDEYRYAILRP